jgi:hypothetical protein
MATDPTDDERKRRTPRRPRRDPDERFFLCHVQKTAGTSLFLGLHRVFHQRELYPNDTDGDLVVVAPQLSVPQLEKRWAERGHEIRMLTGHFPLCTIELLDAEFTTLTMLREPVERTLSYLRHHRKLTPGEADRPLEDIYEDPFRFDGLIHNHMVKMFSLTPETMTAGMLTEVDFTRGHLERACERLATVDHVGLQEDFEGFWNELVEELDWDLGPTAHANRTGTAEVDEAFRARIAEDNALDVELYEFARRLVADRAATRTR